MNHITREVERAKQELIKLEVSNDNFEKAFKIFAKTIPTRLSHDEIANLMTAFLAAYLWCTKNAVEPID